jgi:sugar-specific transcriptional regulator TrmB
MSQTEDESIEIFTKLGLTYVQTKLYLTLVRLGSIGGDVKKISRESSVARQDIYRVLPSLQKLGLTEKIISKPTSYRAIPLEKGFSTLINKKTSEYSELKKKAKQVFDKVALEATKDETDEDPQFVITSERGLFLRKVKEDIEETKSCIRVIYSKERLSTIVFHTADQLEKAMARGIKIQALTNKAEENKLDKNIQTLKKNPAFELRFVVDVAVGLIIFDHKEVNLRTSKTMVPSLWTNNQNVAKLADIYFENLWKKAQTA